MGRLACAALLLGGCFKPTYPEGLACGTGAQPCPPGMTCGADDRCRSTNDEGDGPPGGDGGGDLDGGSDAPEPDAVVCNMPTTGVVATEYRTGVTVSADSSPTFMMAEGHSIHGTVMLAGGPSGAIATGGSVVLTASGKEYRFDVVVTDGAQMQYDYQMFVPADTYAMEASFRIVVPVSGSSAAATVTSRVRSVVTVCGDTLENASVPPIDGDEVGVTISNLADLRSIAGSSQLVVVSLEDADLTSSFLIDTSTGTPSEVTGSTFAPNRTLTPTVFYFNDGGTYRFYSSVRLAPEAPPTGAGYILTFPLVRRLSGTLNDSNNLVSLTDPGSVTCANAVTGQASGATPSTEPARDFVTFVPDGATCPIVADVGIDLPGGTNVEGHLRWPVPATPTTFGTDITWAQSVPTLAGTHRLNATVRDASGNPLAGMIVSAASTSLVGTSLVNASYSSTATTDSAGMISMILADGTYDVVIIRASP